MTSDFMPLAPNQWPRFTQIATFMRLPHIPLDDARAKEVEVALVGIPFDLGVTNRTGPRHGPRQIRDQSSVIRRFHRTHKFSPFALAMGALSGGRNSARRSIFRPPWPAIVSTSR